MRSGRSQQRGAGICVFYVLSVVTRSVGHTLSLADVHRAMAGELRFDGQVALITGSGRGLGKEYALLLASRGCKVVVNDVNRADADATASDINRMGGTGGDLAAVSYDSVEDGAAIVATALAAFDNLNRIDILVNNAGILTPEPWAELPLTSWEKTMAVNLTGTFSVTAAAWPVLVAAEYGRVINIASPAVFGAGVAAYSASKAAIIGFRFLPLHACCLMRCLASRHRSRHS